MKSLTRPSFWRAYDALDARIRESAKRAFVQFAKDPNHPSLRFKKLGGYDQVWSARINEQYRAVGERDGDAVVWIWIGSHNDFDSLFVTADCYFARHSTVSARPSSDCAAAMATRKRWASAG